jgi:hypothetical protein
LAGVQRHHHDDSYRGRGSHRRQRQTAVAQKPAPLAQSCQGRPAQAVLVGGDGLARAHDDHARRLGVVIRPARSPVAWLRCGTPKSDWGGPNGGGCWSALTWPPMRPRSSRPSPCRPSASSSTLAHRRRAAPLAAPRPGGVLQSRVPRSRRGFLYWRHLVRFGLNRHAPRNRPAAAPVAPAHSRAGAREMRRGRLPGSSMSEDRRRDVCWRGDSAGVVASGSPPVS